MNSSCNVTPGSRRQVIAIARDRGCVAQAEHEASTRFRGAPAIREALASPLAAATRSPGGATRTLILGAFLANGSNHHGGAFHYALHHKFQELLHNQSEAGKLTAKMRHTQGEQLLKAVHGLIAESPKLCRALKAGTAEVHVVHDMQHLPASVKRSTGSPTSGVHWHFHPPSPGEPLVHNDVRAPLP